jgi:isoquinoline 1-oxidoreductase subunit alpha
MAHTMEVNGLKRTVDVDGDTPLLWARRDELDLKGQQVRPGVGFCGTCTVHLNGEAKRSCVRPISTVGGATVPTMEGMASLTVGLTLQAA